MSRPIVPRGSFRGDVLSLTRLRTAVLIDSSLREADREDIAAQIDALTKRLIHVDETRTEACAESAE